MYTLHTPTRVYDVDRSVQERDVDAEERELSQLARTCARCLKEQRNTTMVSFQTSKGKFRSFVICWSCVAELSERMDG
jgi:superfamily II helicase